MSEAPDLNPINISRWNVGGKQTLRTASALRVRRALRGRARRSKMPHFRLRALRDCAHEPGDTPLLPSPHARTTKAPRAEFTAC
jgi:hypothetical protein